ncbi:XkdX family protein [Nicoliella lavandulae]|uniref:XkdX family protein n=1 Tax=Nicoliella lavandulae TaxID=3082954 RepID=A0ABU8SMC0_9LACO
MFGLLKMEYGWGWLGADELKMYVNWGSITQEQYDQITGANQATQSSATDSQSAAQSSAAASQTPASSAQPSAQPQSTQSSVTSSN